MKIPFLVSITSYLTRNKAPVPTVSQDGIQARAIRYLIANGSITVRHILNMGTNDAYKMIHRMRRYGLLYEVGDPHGERLVKNANGVGEHKVYRWTGNIPASWANCRDERRHRQRGGM